MDLELQKQDLLERWKHAFNEIELLQQYKDKIQTERYIPGFRYDLKDYDTPLFLKPEEKLFPEARSREISDYHFYGFTTDGMPCYTSFGHRVSKVNWQGYYSYSKNLVEYIEFCMETGIPSTIKRFIYEDGEKAIFQSLSVNSRGSIPIYKGSPKEEIIAGIIDDQHSLFCTVEKYTTENGKILKADCIAIAPGAGEYRYAEVYRYDENNKLDEIRTVYEDGKTSLAYVQLNKNIDINQLSLAVSENMASAIIDTLQESRIEVPLSLLEINYKSITEYMPLLTPRSLAFTEEISRNHEEEDIFDLIFLSTEVSHAYMEINPAGFERLFRQFIQIVEREEKWDLGTAMLRRVAYLLTTNKLNNKIPVSNEFAAYAIDWESEMEEFEDILLECGLSGSVISSWKERGWL
ncbi:hypothetical protein SAMN05518672_103170 [Chitinophaga sp. CF118]|uniref:hypothetical protein n=1 Tax=Chitinophaga sp. CF118 TaxID=1884367 RepID=UPI0008E3FBED|nr:hypothetical protein [Chitinophaga sp. CF118]SFD77581.1 hypothetical protein SAMN05518672_103170 [Chitinophaga sp. CF118]